METTIYSFQNDKIRLQIVKNDNKLRYELRENRKLIYESNNIYWCKRAMEAKIAYLLLGIVYRNDEELSIYNGTGKRIFENV